MTEKPACGLSEWQIDILIRDRLKAMTEISYLANILYPEFAFAKDREAKLLEIPEMQRLAGKLRDIVATCTKRLQAGK